MIGEKLVKPVLELGVLLLFGIAALILILLFGGSGASKRFNRHLNTPITAVATAGPEDDLGPYDSSDWASDSEAPVSYFGQCITSNTLHCAQGPCGGRSHAKSGSRAVDLNWAGMGSNPGIQAPTDGVILSKSTPIAYCSDGTRKGGSVYFKDSNGYTWWFAHARPVASGSVKAGDIIGQVQLGGPEVERGACWDDPHAHVQIWDPSGKLVDAEQFINSTGCNFSCPAGDRCR